MVGLALQDLIAPKAVRFFDVGWTLLGDKLYLLDTLCLATRISSKVLSDTESLHSACAAQRMSWAAGRETTRGEDRAYSLMGLFEVNMPMLYGEGPINAFIRSQGEIMRRSDDHSLFAWSDEEAPDNQLHGHLVDIPDVFNFHNVDMIRQNRYVRSKEPHTMTNRGLQIKLTLLPQLKDMNMVYAASLDCHWGDPPRPLYLRLMQLDPEDNLYARVKCRNLLFEHDLNGTYASTQSIYIPQSIPRSFPKGQRPEMQFFRCGPINITHFRAIPPINAAHMRLDDRELNQIKLLYSAARSDEINAQFFRIENDLDLIPRVSLTVKGQVFGDSVVLIQIGSFGNGRVGFDVGPRLLCCRPFGSCVEYKGHSATVNADVILRHGVRIYDLTFNFTPLATSSGSRPAGKAKSSSDDTMYITPRLRSILSRHRS